MCVSFCCLQKVFLLRQRTTRDTSLITAICFTLFNRDEDEFLASARHSLTESTAETRDRSLEDEHSISFDSGRENTLSGDNSLNLEADISRGGKHSEAGINPASREGTVPGVLSERDPQFLGQVNEDDNKKRRTTHKDIKAKVKSLLTIGKLTFRKKKLKKATTDEVEGMANKTERHQSKLQEKEAEITNDIFTGDISAVQPNENETQDWPGGAVQTSTQDSRTEHEDSSLDTVYLGITHKTDNEMDGRQTTETGDCFSGDDVVKVDQKTMSTVDDPPSLGQTLTFDHQKVWETAGVDSNVENASAQEPDEKHSENKLEEHDPFENKTDAAQKPSAVTEQTEPDLFDTETTDNIKQLQRRYSSRKRWGKAQRPVFAGNSSNRAVSLGDSLEGATFASSFSCSDVTESEQEIEPEIVEEIRVNRTKWKRVVAQIRDRFTPEDALEVLTEGKDESCDFSEGGQSWENRECDVHVAVAGRCSSEKLQNEILTDVERKPIRSQDTSEGVNEDPIVVGSDRAAEIDSAKPRTMAAEEHRDNTQELVLQPNATVKQEVKDEAPSEKKKKGKLSFLRKSKSKGQSTLDVSEPTESGEETNRKAKKGSSKMKKSRSVTDLFTKTQKDDEKTKRKLKKRHKDVKDSSAKKQEFTETEGQRPDTTSAGTTLQKESSPGKKEANETERDLSDHEDESRSKETIHQKTERTGALETTMQAKTDSEKNKHKNRRKSKEAKLIAKENAKPSVSDDQKDETAAAAADKPKQRKKKKSAMSESKSTDALSQDHESVMQILASRTLVHCPPTTLSGSSGTKPPLLASAHRKNIAIHVCENSFKMTSGFSGTLAFVALERDSLIKLLTKLDSKRLMCKSGLIPQGDPESRPLGGSN